MLTFNYEAKDRASGKHVKSTVQADTEAVAYKLLIDQGYTPTKITEQGRGGGLLGSLSNRITTKDRVVFSRQLATLIGAGLPLSQSLHTVVEQTENTKMKSVAQDILVSVEGGKALAEAFSKHPDVFDTVFISLVEAGETSGTLDKALERIAAQQEKDAEMMGKIRGAMVYPAIVLAVIFGVMIFMLFTIVPQVEKLYSDLHQQLPLISQIMVNTASFLIKFWWAAILVIGAAIYFGIRYFKTPDGKRFSDAIKLNAPVIGPLFRKLYMARFTRTGATLLSTGVPMLDALEICAKSVNNSYVADAILRASEKVKNGKGLAESLENEDYILKLAPQMIGIGEKSGRVDEMMSKTASVYESELDATIRAISTIIEPVLMVVLAVVAGGMVAAILLPIYQLVGNIKV
ncbi:MAG: type II secretion system F family protein [Candidatus Saccharibacteria bacterium]|nr:type II secretion system F family protein [Candidatus Saccharibacteria bacterium]